MWRSSQRHNMCSYFQDVLKYWTTHKTMLTDIYMERKPVLDTLTLHYVNLFLDCSRIAKKSVTSEFTEAFCFLGWQFSLVCLLVDYPTDPKWLHQTTVWASNHMRWKPVQMTCVTPYQVQQKQRGKCGLVLPRKMHLMFGSLYTRPIDLNSSTLLPYLGMLVLQHQQNSWYDDLLWRNW